MKNILKVNLEAVICDIGFVMVTYISLYLFSAYSNGRWDGISPMARLISIAGSIIIIYIFPVKPRENKKIYENKKAMLSFILIEVFVLFLSIILNNSPVLKSYVMKNTYLSQFIITSTIFICYFFNIKLKNFNWNISVRTFVMVIVTFAFYYTVLFYNNIFLRLTRGSNIINIKLILNILLKLIREVFYPGVFEEILYRGFLITGLKGFGLSNNECNIIQAILFGLTHFMISGSVTSLLLLHTAAQAMAGYILGKIYFKTKSLTPCILFHGLLDTLNF